MFKVNEFTIFLGTAVVFFVLSFWLYACYVGYSSEYGITESDRVTEVSSDAFDYLPVVNRVLALKPISVFMAGTGVLSILLGVATRTKYVKAIIKRKEEELDRW